MGSYSHTYLQYVKTTDNIITEVGDFFCEFTQYAKHEIIGQTTQSLFRDLLRTNINISDLEEVAEAFIFTKSLEVRNVYIHKSKERENNQLKFIVHEMPNSRFGEKNQAVEKMLSDELVGVGVYTTPDFILIKANQTYLNYLPEPFKSKENVYGKYVGEFIKAFEGSAGQKKWNDIIINNQSIVIIEKQGLLLNGDNQYWDNTLIPIMEEGGVKYLVSILSDVTERVLSKEHIARQAKIIKGQNKELEAIFQNISDGIAVIDKNGKFIRLNDSLTKIMKENSAIGVTVDQAGDTIVKGQEYYDENGLGLSFQDLPSFKVLNGETVVNQRVLVKNGLDITYLDFSATPVYEDNGDFLFGIITSHDISDYVKSQEALKAVQDDLIIAERAKNEGLELSLKQKDEFLSLISHEFKTPLTVINSAVQTMELLNKNELTPKTIKYLNMIRQNSNRQLRLVNNILDITRLNAGRLTINKRNIDIVFLTKAIADSVQPFAILRGIDLSFESRVDEKIIGIDDEKYERVLLNLLSNAIKFTSPGKTVNVQLSAKNDNISIVVKDEGIGIPRDKQVLIFERFGQVDNTMTRQSEGTGIGLTLVKNIVEAFGGSISVESEPGVGSTFTVLLPDEKVQDAEDHEKTNANSGSNHFIHQIAVEFSDIYSDNYHDLFQSSEDSYTNLHSKVQKLLEREELLKSISYELNNMSDIKTSLNSVLLYIKQYINCQALGIRLSKDGDYPYLICHGFSDSFIQMENLIASGCCDSDRNSLECICGRIIHNETNPGLNFYTNKGSFWTNNASSLKNLRGEIQKYASYRGTCLKQGFESSVLIPIKSCGVTFGLLQLNDTTKDRFTFDEVELLEMIGEHIGSSIAHLMK